MGASMSARLRIAMAQINPVVGDISGNVELIKSSVVQARDAGADVIVFPEMVLTGYPVEDLALRPAFRRASIDAIQILAREIKELGAGDLLALVGYLDEKEKPHNAVALIHDGIVKAKYIKHHLPNYGVFDEFRNFGQGEGSLIARFRGVDIPLLSFVKIFGKTRDLWPNYRNGAQESFWFQMAVLMNATRTICASR